MKLLQITAILMGLTYGAAFGRQAPSLSEKFPWRGEGSTTESCAWDLAQKLKSDIFKEEYRLGDRLQYRYDISNRKYWIKVLPENLSEEAAGENQYYITFRAYWDQSIQKCFVDTEAINPLYISDAFGRTLLAAGGQYNNMAEKIFATGASAMLYLVGGAYFYLNDAFTLHTPAPGFLR